MCIPARSKEAVRVRMRVRRSGQVRSGQVRSGQVMVQVHRQGKVGKVMVQLVWVLGWYM